MTGKRSLPAPAASAQTKFSEEYLDHVKARCASNTARTYETRLKDHILPGLGDLMLGRMNPGCIQKHADARMLESSASTVMQKLQILSGLSLEAMRRELVERSPIALVKKPRLENTVVQYLDQNEENRLLERAHEPLRSAIIVAIHSGLREEEQAALQWVMVRRAEGIIVVRKTKSKRDRVLPINATLKGALEGVYRHPSSPYVFTNPDTRDRYDRFNNGPWRKPLVRAGVKALRWHDLRHTFGSRLAQAGRSIPEIRELMGHRDVTVTMRYAHVAPSNQREAVMAMDKKSCQTSCQAGDPKISVSVSH